MIGRARFRAWVENVVLGVLLLVFFALLFVALPVATGASA